MKYLCQEVWPRKIDQRNSEKMKLATGILAIAEAASVGGQVPSNAVCRDPDTGVVYQPNEEWVRRGFQLNFLKITISSP